MPNISHNLAQIRADILKASRKSGQPEPPKLIAVSKRQPQSAIIEAYEAGQRNFGENYAQELEAKAKALQKQGVCWHFIGPIQSNKTRIIATYSDWVHSIDRIKVAERLSHHRSTEQPDLQVCIQVNVDNAPNKSGVHPNELPQLIDAIHVLPRLQLRGLMAIPDKHNAAQAFLALAKQADHYQLSELSMGMSQDMEAAITAGSTMLRIGTAIFGPRSVVKKI